MRTKLFCMMVLCTGLLVGCDKETEKSEIPENPPVEKPEQPETPTTLPSTDDIIKTRIGDENMIIGTTDWRDIAYGNGRYVVVGDGGYVTSSTDGVIWETPKIIPRSDFNWVSVTFGNGKFVAIDKYTPCNVMTSIDGLNWTQEGKVLPINGSNNRYNSVEFVNGIFIASGDNTITTSTNGKVWTIRYTNTSRYCYGIAYGNNKFVEVGDYGYSHTSDDGVTWVEKKILETKYALMGVAFGNGKFVAVGSYGIIISSEDGVNWLNPIKLGTNHNWVAIAYNNGKFMIISMNGYVTTSADGINWTTPEQLKDESGNIVTVTLNGVCAMP